MRITNFSPNAVGIVEIRSSTSWPSGASVLMRPSCGRRFSTISMRARSLIRDVIAISTGAGMAYTWCSTPSMRKRTRPTSRRGSMWMSDARCSNAYCHSQSTMWTTCWSLASRCPCLPSSTSCSKLPTAQLSLVRRLRALHRAGEVEEFAQVTLDVGRVREDELDLELEDLGEFVGPRTDERLAGRHRQRTPVDGHRKDPVTLGVGIGHRRRHRAQVDLQRIDVQVRDAELARQPFHQPLQRHQLVGRLERLPLPVGDRLERVLESMRARTRKRVGLGGRHQPVGQQQLEDVVQPQPPVLRLEDGGRVRCGARGGRRLDTGHGCSHPITLHRRRRRHTAKAPLFR